MVTAGRGFPTRWLCLAVDPERAAGVVPDEERRDQPDDGDHAEIHADAVHSAGAGLERLRDHGSERAAQYRAERVRDRGATVTDVCGIHFGEQRRLWSVRESEP